ncbi:MAG TPA: dimethylmenaquinone methyltransferase [Prolixibacteraceae bacterium]|nr:dimethylmenaquinone methyltransferase [Prolixibacteraceae bacterium]
MKKQTILIIAFVLVGLFANSQSVKWSSDAIKALTSEWTGERTPDGRPKVSDKLLERLKNLSMEEVWGFLESKGYENQFENFSSTFENGWQIIHPEKVMTGRVVTGQFMPLRKDYDNYVQAQGKKENLTSPVTNYAPINALSNGDVYVADSYVKIEDGTLIGDNLGNAIYKNGKRGIIFNGSVRDVEGLSEIEGFNGWIRGSDPSAIKQMMLTTVNAPIRIGRVTVLPGDVVLAKIHGVTFIPPHLVEECVISGEYTALHDEFNFFCIKTQKFKYDNERFVDVTPEDFEKAFVEWINVYPNLPMDKKVLFDYMEKHKAEVAARKAAAPAKK